MKMKRWISILLTLALCLGLLPGTVLAEEVTGAEIGLKLCTDEAGTTEVSKVDGVYNVGIAEGVTTTVYLHITGGDNAVFADGTNFTMTVNPSEGEVTIVSSELLENNTVLAITHHGDRDWATMENTRGITVGEKEFSFVIKFVNSDSGTGDDEGGSGSEDDDPITETSIGLQLYAADGTTSIAANEDGSYIVNISEGTDTIVYVRITGDDTAVFDEGTEFVVSVDGPPVPIVDSTLSTDGKSLEITHHGSVDSAYLESGRTLSVNGQSVGLTICFVPTVIYDDKNSSVFPVTAGNPQAFTFPPHVYVGKILTRITNEDYTFTCDEQIGSLFWHEEYNELAINTSGVTGVASGKIYATSKTDPTKVYTCTVTVKAAAGGDEGGSGGEEDDSTGTTLESGVYTTLTEGQLGGYVEIAKIYGDEGPWGYRVDYTTGQSITVYYYNAEEAHTCTSEDADYMPVAGMDGVYAITLHSGKIGEVVVDLTLGDGGFPIVFSDGYSQMYYQFTEGSYATDIELSLGGSTALNGNLFADANGATAIDLSGHTLSFDKDGLGSIINAPDGNTVWVTNDITAEASGYLYAVNNSDSSVKYAIAVSVKEQSGPPSGGGDDNSSIEYTLVTVSRDITDGDKITREVAEKIQVGPASFQYDTDNDQTPETYYICAMGGAAEGEYHMSISGGSGSPDGQFWSDFSLGIWTYNPKGDTYSLVSDEIQEILLKSFGDSWSFELYNTTSSENTAYSSTYPAVYSWTDPNGWPLGVAFQYVEPGDWYYGFSGTINNTTVTSYTRSSFKLVNEVEYDAESIADVNDFLQQWEATEKAEGYPRKRVYIINLPEGRFEGNIIVPEGFYWVNVIGKGEDKTTLVGGIDTGSTLRVQSLTMEGCGWNNAVQSDGVTPNYGIYGTGSGRYNHCTFRNYYHALHATGGLFFGGEFGTFENNLIALYLNSPRNGGGATSMEDCIYRHNGCALWLEDFGNDFPMNSYHVLRCKFYDNGWDVINLLGKCFFLPGQLFERDGQYGHGKFAGRRDALITPPKETAPQRASHAAANVSEEGSGVYTFPVAKDDKFNDFDYTNKDAVIGNHNASDWLIPEDDLNGKTITVIQDEKGEDKIVWSFGE